MQEEIGFGTYYLFTLLVFFPCKYFSVLSNLNQVYQKKFKVKKVEENNLQLSQGGQLA